MIKSDLLKYSSSKVFAPASISNVGPGFDSFGFAIDQPGDIIEVYASNSKGVRIRNISGDQGRISKNIAENTASVGALSILRKIKADFGVDIVIRKKMPFCSGLGSSAASAVGAVFAVNELLKKKLTLNELIYHGLEGEKITSGNHAHADNVAPALFGGFTVVRSLEPMEIVRLPFPEELFCLVIFPHIEIKTEYARKILPKNISLRTAVRQAANSASLIAGILTRDFPLMSHSMTDYLAEPVRAKLIPCYEELKSIILSYKALNFNISGSGPALFSFFEKKDIFDLAGAAARKFFKNASVKGTIFPTKVNNQGPKIIELR
ncbi:MAG: homoserine kinase [Methanococcaceae archaeon]